MHLLTAFAMRCLKLNILFLARHVPVVENEVADALSYKPMKRFQQLSPDADLCECDLHCF